MLIFNGSSRIIDGIKPKEALEIEEERAKTLLRLYPREIQNLKVSGNNPALIEENTKLKNENENLKAIINSLKTDVESRKETIINEEEQEDKKGKSKKK